MRIIKRFFLVLAIALVVLLGVASLLLLPSVQKAVLLRVLNTPEQSVSVEEVRIGWGAATIRKLRIERPFQTIEVERVETRHRLLPLLLRREVLVEHLLITGLIADIEDTPEPDPVPELPREPFAGLLPDFPLNLYIGEAEVRAEVRLPDDSRWSMALTSREFSTQAEENSLQISLEARAEEGLLAHGLLVEALLRPAFSPQGLLERIDLEMASETTDPAGALLTMRGGIERTPGGETYRLRILEGAGVNDAAPLAELEGDWNQETGDLAGGLSLDLPSELNFPQMELHPFAATGSFDFLLGSDGAFHLKGTLSAGTEGLSDAFDLPPGLDQIDTHLEVDLLVEKSLIEIALLNLRAGSPTEDFFRIEVPEPLRWDLREGLGRLPERDSPLAVIDVPGISGEWIDLLIPGLRVHSEPLSGQLALLSDIEGAKITTPRPFSIEHLTIRREDETLLKDAFLSLEPTMRIDPNQFAATILLRIDSPSTGELESVLEATGPFPLSQIDSSFRLVGSKLPSPIPYQTLSLESSAKIDWASLNNGEGQSPFTIHFEGTPAPEGDLPEGLLPHRVLVEGSWEKLAARHRLSFETSSHSRKELALEPTLHSTTEWDAANRGIEGMVDLRLPNWILPALSQATGTPFDELSLNSVLSYSGTISPLNIGWELGASVEASLEEDLFPGHRTFLTHAEAGGRLEPMAVLNRFELAAGVPEETDWISLALLQPVTMDNQSQENALGFLPEGDILSLKISLPEPTLLMPEELRRTLQTGGLVGSLTLNHEASNIRMEPEEPFQLSSIRYQVSPNQWSHPTSLQLRPFFSMQNEQIRGGLEQFSLQDDQGPLLEGFLRALVVRGPNDDSNDSAEGNFLVEAPLGELNRIFPEPILPNLERGLLSVRGQIQDDLEGNSRFSGQVTIDSLRALDSLQSFQLGMNFEGNRRGSNFRGQLETELDSARGKQDLKLNLAWSAGADDNLPSLRVRGESKLVDTVALAEMARSFQDAGSGFAPPAVTPDALEPKTDGGLLPFNLDALYLAERLHTPVDLRLGSLQVSIAGGSDRIEVPSGRLRVEEDGEISFRGRLSQGSDGFVFQSEMDGENLDAGRLIRKVSADGTSPMEGTYQLRGNLHTSADTMEELFSTVDGSLRLKGVSGRLRPEFPPGYARTLQGLIGAQSGLLGQALGRVAPGAGALVRSIELLTDIPYDELIVEIDISREQVLDIHTFQLIGPYLSVRGDGHLSDFAFDRMEDAGLDIKIQMGAKPDLDRQLEILDLTALQRDERGYLPLKQPIRITGTVGDPDLDELWAPLMRAGSGATMGPRELQRRDEERARAREALEQGESQEQQPPATELQPEEEEPRQRDTLEEAIDDTVRDLRRRFGF